MRKITGVLTCALLAFAVGCGKSERDTTPAGSPGGSSTASGRTGTGGTGGGPAEEESKPLPAIDVEKIKAVFPEKVAGLDRGEVRGASISVGELNTASADTTYAAGEKSIDVHVVDTGMSNAQAAQAMPTNMRFSDDKTSSGTTTVQGFKAWEKIDKEQNAAELIIYVGRFVVTAEGSAGISVDDLKKAIAEIDMRKLDALK